MGSTDVLPTGGRLIHLGPPKTGTTAIQAALHASREALAGHGIRVLPADRPRDWQAGLTLFGGTRPGSGYTPDLAWWERFVAEVDATEGTLVISNEAFAKADDEGVARLVRDLGDDGARYLYVARRLDKMLLSHWQESIKGGGARLDVETWVGDEFDRRDSQRGGFWRQNDIADVMDRLLAHVAPEHVTILIADEGDRDQLPRFFEQTLGVPTGTLRAPDHSRSNRSLSLNEAELIRLLNLETKDREWTAEDRRFLIKRGLVNHLQASPRSRGDVAIRMPSSHRALVEDQTERRVAAITELDARGVRVVGDLARLTPPADSYTDHAPVADELGMPITSVVEVVAATVEAARVRRQTESETKQRLRTPGTRRRFRLRRR